MRIITLTTDFGQQDWFVGVMKGVILGIHPEVTIVDITHEVAPGDIWAGAFALAAACDCFPSATIHVAIVDPGVGSRRRALAVRTEQSIFVGPDNGVLSLALRKEEVVTAVELRNNRFFRQPVSVNFHGRDIFAPVAAHISRGIDLSELGPPVQDYVKLTWPSPHRTGDEIAGQIVYVDRFGNAVTNIENHLIGSVLSRFRIQVANHPVPIAIGECYQSVASGQPVALLGSHGYLEIALNGASAAAQLSLRVGDFVQVIEPA